MKILFITKNYPPQKGGLEQYSYDWYTYMSKHAEVQLIANRYGKVFLPIYFFVSLFKGLWITRTSDIIYVGDASISFVGFVLAKLYKKKLYGTVHGLDITWDNKIYQVYVKFFLKKYDKIVCVSDNTKNECIKRGIYSRNISVIPNGISDEWGTINCCDYKNYKKDGKIMLLSLGRWIERKGFHWFLENIYSKFGQDRYVYIIVGSGKYEKRYKNIISTKRIRNIYLKQNVSDEEKIWLYLQADCFIMPNIKVQNDVEGFGIVAIESSWLGTPVIAVDIDGIRDAVTPNETGILLPEDADWSIWNLAIDKALQFDRVQVSRKTKQKYSWDKLIHKYLDILR